MKVKRFLATALTVILTFGMVVPSVTMAMAPTGSLEIEVPESGDAEITHDDCICDECNEEFDVGTYDVELGSENLDTFEGGVEIENPTVDDLIVEEPIVNPVIEEPEEEPKEEPIEEEQTVEEPEVEEASSTVPEGWTAKARVPDYHVKYVERQEATTTSDGHLAYYEIYPNTELMSSSTYWLVKNPTDVVYDPLFNTYYYYGEYVYLSWEQLLDNGGRIPKIVTKVQFFDNTPIVRQEEETGKMYIDMDIINNDMEGATHPTENAYVHIEWVDKNTGALVSKDIPFELAVSATTSIKWELPDCTAIYTVCLYDHGSQVSNIYCVGGYTHSINHEAGVAATCTTPGYKDYYICKQCGKYFEDNKGTKEITDLEAWKSEGGAGYIAINVNHGDALITEPGVAATCTTPGYRTYYYCTACGKYYEDEAGTKEITDIEAWKSEGGNGYIAINPTEHTKIVQMDEGTEPTMETTGTRAYWHCEGCNKYYANVQGTLEIKDFDTWYVTEGDEWEDGRIIPKLTYKFTITSEISKDGRVILTIENTGEIPLEELTLFITDVVQHPDEPIIQRVREVDPGEKHKQTVTLKYPISKDDGILNVKLFANSWGEEEIGTFLWENTFYWPHDCNDRKEIDNRVEPTCTETGLTAGSHCGYCGKVLVEQKVIPATGHSVETFEGWEATCTTEGFRTYYYCKKCNKYFLDEDCTKEITNFKEWRRTESTDPTEGGIIPIVNKHSLTYVPEYTPCDLPGWWEHWHCEDCGKNFTDDTATEEIEDISLMRGHVYDDTREANIVEPTCTEEGSYDIEKHCTRCGEWITWMHGCQTAALGHQMEDAPQLDPTCTEAGHKAYSVCTRDACNYAVDENGTPIDNLDTWLAEGGDGYIAPTGHTPGEVVIENVIDATCQQPGSIDEVVYCTECGEELARNTAIIPQLMHIAGEEVVENVVDATCEHSGSQDIVTYCTVCGDELTRETVTIPQLMHITDKVVIENYVEPTAKQAGGYDEVLYCTLCNKEVSRTHVTIPATGYSISKVEYKYLPDTGVVFIYAQDATVGKITTAITITKYEQDDVVLEYVMEVVDEMNGHANLYVEYTDLSNPVLQAPSF